MTRIQRVRDRFLEEDGSLSVFLLMTVVVLVVVIGLVVDAAGKYQADAQAQQIAANTARSAVNSIGGNTVLSGDLTLDSAQAETAAKSYLSAAGVAGTVTVSGEVVTVNVKTVYTTKFISLLGIDTLNGAGHASAQLITQ